MEISINAQDFDYLHSNGTLWRGAMDSWDEQIEWGRFRPYIDGEIVERHHRFAYFYKNYMEIILSRAFLADLGENFQVLSDESECGGWVIITDWAAPSWVKWLDTDYPNG